MVTGNKKVVRPWRRIFFIEMLVTFLLFCLVGIYVFWHVVPLDQYCDELAQCIVLAGVMAKVKLAVAAGVIFIYSFLGPLAVLFAMPFFIYFVRFRLK